MECYVRAEKMTSIFSKYLSGLCTGIIVATICSAIAQTILEVTVNGMDLEESYLLSVICTMPFDVSTWKRFAVASAWANFNYVTVIATKVVQAIIQMTFCFYSIAVIRNLQTMATELSQPR